MKFAVPCVISLRVNSLYNIVDQIFVGWGVGYLGNGATTVVFPITIIALAFAVLVGDGGAAYLSLKQCNTKRIPYAKVSKYAGIDKNKRYAKILIPDYHKRFFWII